MDMALSVQIYISAAVIYKVLLLWKLSVCSIQRGSDGTKLFIELDGKLAYVYITFNLESGSVVLN